MSNSNFSGGFLLGALVGGAIGGAIGAAVVSQSKRGTHRKPKLTGRDRSLDSTSGSIDPEVKRRELEAKIAHLNDTIDDVREQLHVVHKSVPAADTNDAIEVSLGNP
jgi:gas vesicle protein